MINLIHGDCLEAMKAMEADSVDSIVTDPPYGISFMGKKWDYDVPSIELWQEVLRVLKPGAYALVACGTRTQHRMAVNLEDAGFEIRDIVFYLYGSGFPKSLNIEKALEKYGVYKKISSESEAEYDMRSMRETDLSQTVNIEKEQGQILQPSLPEQGLYPTMQGEKSKQGLANGEKSCMEGGSNLLEKTRELQACKICEMSERIYRNGEEGWLCNGTSLNNGNTFKKNIEKNGSNTSYQSQSPRQSNKKPNDFSEQQITQAIRRFKGFGTALKPACECWTLCRKPLSEKTVAQNVLKWGTGGINIDGCRIPTLDGVPQFTHRREPSLNCYGDGKNGSNRTGETTTQGRFPANIIHDGSEEVMALFPDSKGQQGDVRGTEPSHTGQNGIYGDFARVQAHPKRIDSGSAARFFYTAKASRSERNEGLEGWEEKSCGMMEDDNYPIKTGSGNLRNTKRTNHHPTVKPIALMSYLCRLITPPAGTILDPFMGSGSTGIAAYKEGFSFIGIEREKEFYDIAEARIDKHQQQGVLFK